MVWIKENWAKTVKMSVLLLVALAVVACGADTPNPQQSNGKEGSEMYEMNKEPVTITFYNAGANPESYFKQYIEPHIRKHLPHITLDYIQQATGSQIKDLLSAGTVPDIMYVVSTRITELNELGVLADLTPLAAKHQFDLNILQEGLVDTFRSYGDGQLLFMPWGLSNYALYYNKDIFDRFGTAYPRDGMFWDEVYELARTLTRTVDGVQYRGFDFNPTFFINYNQLSLPFIHPVNDTAAVQTNEWKRLFETFGQFYRIPGNEVASDRKPEDFRNHKTVAMTAGTSQFPQILEMYQKGEPFNFNITSFPSFPEQPKTGLQTVAAGFVVSPLSKHQDQAMDIIKLMLSEEVQKEGAEIFRLPVVKGEQYRDMLGKFYPELAGVHVSSLTYNTNAPTKVVSPYDNIARGILISRFNDYKAGKKDVNTALREAEEEINKKIAEEKAIQGQR